MLVEVNVAAIQTLDAISHVSADVQLRNGECLGKIEIDATAVL